jgi:hypothetical protein
MPIPVTSDEGLFLETKAQIIRLIGSNEMKRGILDLMNDFDKVGSSQFVQNKFEAILGELYQSIADAMGRVQGQHRPQAFDDLWTEAAELLSPYIYDGLNLLSIISMKLAFRYSQRLIAPIEIKNFIEGQRLALLGSFLYGDEFFDRSSCCVWQSKGLIQCSTGPSPNCRLKLICINGREEFIATIRTLASLSGEDSKWLKTNLHNLIKMSDLELMETVGSNPEHFGDLIVFWEVPDKWTILTRSETFSILQHTHRPKISIYWVRLPRIISENTCVVQTAASSRLPQQATLLNYNSMGVCIAADGRLAKIGGEVRIMAGEFDGPQEGKIVRIETNGKKVIHGIKLLNRHG